jgi:curved DNA binding protein
MVITYFTPDVLAKLIKKISVGSKIIDLCVFSDNLIYEELHKVYNKKPTFKGLAFPTTISVNEICAHNSPLPEDSTSVKEGDLVKVELGVHIDGFPAFVGHSFVVKSDNAPVTGPKADAILAAYKAKEAALRLIKPGHTNNQVTALIAKVCESYNVNAVEGVLSHELKKHLIDGNKVILNKETFDQKTEEQEFAIHDVFDFEVMVSTGEGKPKDVDIRCTIFKRAMDQVYNLKVKQSRQFINEVLNKYPSFCFSLNAFEDEISAKLGVKECVQHDMLVPYPVMSEKPGQYVAVFRTTVMITKGKTTALTGVTVDESQFKSEHSIKDEQILGLLSVIINPNIAINVKGRAEEGKKAGKWRKGMSKRSNLMTV